MKKELIYIGTYSTEKSKGIYLLNPEMLKIPKIPEIQEMPEIPTIQEIHTDKSVLIPAGLPAELKNPSFLAVSRDNKYLYTVVETDEFQQQPGGAVASFSIDKNNGKLKLINTQSTKGRIPCHISVDSMNRFLFAANYGEGTITTFKIEPDGSIGSILSIVRHEGSGPNKERQEKPHVHYVSLTPDEKYLYAVDLGIDMIMLYHFNKEDGSLKLNKSKSISIKPGSGPRHMDFHPNSRYAYLINELSSDIVVLEYSHQDCSFEILQYISALPENYSGISYSSAIHISPDGKWLYTSNRGHDSIAAFSINKNSGKLSLVSHTSTMGNFPRDFAISPDGKYLYASNQHSGTIVPFRILPDTGGLEAAGNTIEVPAPACLVFA